MVEKVSDFGNDGPQYELVCDSCGKSGGLFEEFLGAVQGKKDKGWKSKKIGGMWMDHCKECQ